MQRLPTIPEGFLQSEILCSLIVRALRQFEVETIRLRPYVGPNFNLVKIQVFLEPLHECFGRVNLHRERHNPYQFASSIKDNHMYHSSNRN